MTGTRIASLVAALLLSSLVAGCGGSGGRTTPPTSGAEADAWLGRPAGKTIVVDHYPPGAYDFGARGRSDAFLAAGEWFEREADAARARVEGIRGALGFWVEHDRVEREFLPWHDALRARGAFAVVYEPSFGYGDGLDAVLLLPTDDKWEVIRAIGTDGINYDISNGEVISWLKHLDRTHPFELDEAGIDYVAGRFLHPVQDSGALARLMYRFCPDIVDQGTGSVSKLAAELASSQSLYLWWD